MDEKIKELNLLVLYLSGWEEDSRKNPGQKIFRSWKGFLFEILNEFDENGLITQHRDSKSVVFTEAGRKKADALKKKYMSEAPDVNDGWHPVSEPIPKELNYGPLTFYQNRSLRLKIKGSRDNSESITTGYYAQDKNSWYIKDYSKSGVKCEIFVKLDERYTVTEWKEANERPAFMDDLNLDRFKFVEETHP